MNQPILVGGIGQINFGTQYRQGNRVYDSRAIAMAITANPVGNAGGYTYLYLVEMKPHEQCMEVHRMEGTVEKDGKVYAIRKLTPLECWRLMGFSDEDFHKA